MRITSDLAALVSLSNRLCPTWQRAYAKQNCPTYGSYRNERRQANVHLVAMAVKGAAQTFNLLRATGLEIGLLLNFGPQPQVKRLISARAPAKRRDGDRRR